MNDRDLVEALLARDPNAVGTIYDAHAGHLYTYCWFRLRDRDAAQVALRDTLLVAEAHIQELRDSDRLRPWLYALARIECRRRLTVASDEPDITVASHDQDDVDQRVLAWRAFDALPTLSAELLELRFRHDLADEETALVVSMPAPYIDDLIGQARDLLEEALFAEIAARHGPGTYTPPMAGSVSAAKVVRLLPRVPLAEATRMRVLNYFTDPELVGYRVLAAGRATGFDETGFPEQRRRPLRHRAPKSRGWLRGLVAISVAVLVVGAVASMFRWLDRHDPPASRPTATSAPQTPSP